MSNLQEKGAHSKHLKRMSSLEEIECDWDLGVWVRHCLPHGEE